MATPNQSHPADPDKVEATVVGDFTFSLDYRDVTADEGLTLHVFGPVDGTEEEILRFDCFRKNPHYHLGFSYGKFEAIDIHADDPFNWTIDALTTSFDEFVDRAGADMEGVSDAKHELEQELPRLRAEGQAILAQHK